ncbi:MAG: xanthine dehydrogenase family protein molybdopterin-binding subunit [Geminicoccaceae bacterium]
MDDLSPPYVSRQPGGIGHAVPRKEDARLVTGGGRYSDDLVAEGVLFGHIVRSPVASGRITRLDCDGARALDGVHAVIDGAELRRAGLALPGSGLPLKSRDGQPLKVPPRPAFAVDQVRHIGEPLAMVIAETRALALDAAELIAFDIDPLPAVIAMDEALTEGAPLVHPELKTNVCLDWAYGDEGAVEGAFADAAHVSRLKLENNRVVVAAMEPRAALAYYDGDSGRYTLQLGCQGVFGLRAMLAKDVLKVPVDKVRVIAPDVGGSFGMKAGVYAEYVGLLHASRQLGRPVAWRDERSDSFVSDNQGRASIVDIALALDEAGRFKAVRCDIIGDMGAYLTGFGPGPSTVSMQKNVPGGYRLPVMALRTRCVFTHTTPTGAYRGAGRPEGVYVMERIIDQAARETGRDPIDLRRLNLLRSDELPFEAVSGGRYDSGDFPAVLDRALERADWQARDVRKQRSAHSGKLHGAGVAYYLEVTAPVGREMGGLRFGADGRITMVTGTLDYGQGHASTFAQVLVDKLGVDFDRVDLLQKDSDELEGGGGTGGSRSAMASSTALLEAADRVIDRATPFAADLLEVAAADLAFRDGSFVVLGTDRSVSFSEIERLVREDPDNVGVLNDAVVVETPPSAYPNGCHVAEVEIDPDTGEVAILRYTVVDDFGVLLNPMIVEGQVHGGVVQGLGQALGERVVFDASGQLLSGSFMDYAVPRADQVPAMDVDFHIVPATTNRLGVKGCGEAGCTGALPAVMNAVVDALAPLGISHIDMPATPERVWRAIQEARAR